MENVINFFKPKDPGKEAAHEDRTEVVGGVWRVVKYNEQAQMVSEKFVDKDGKEVPRPPLYKNTDKNKAA